MGLGLAMAADRRDDERRERAFRILTRWGVTLPHGRTDARLWDVFLDEVEKRDQGGGAER